MKQYVDSISFLHFLSKQTEEFDVEKPEGKPYLRCSCGRVSDLSQEWCWGSDPELDLDYTRQTQQGLFNSNYENNWRTNTSTGNDFLCWTRAASHGPLLAISHSPESTQFLIQVQPTSRPTSWRVKCFNF